MELGKLQKKGHRGCASEGRNNGHDQVVSDEMFKVLWTECNFGFKVQEHA